MRPRTCECGQCQVCKNRIYAAQHYGRHRERILARQRAWREARRGTPVQPMSPSLYRVWDAITQQPRASIRELCMATGLAQTTVRHHLRTLCRAGYIEQSPGTRGARRVLVPFFGGPVRISRVVSREVGHAHTELD